MNPDAPDAPARAWHRRALLPALAVPAILALFAGAFFAVDQSVPPPEGGAAARFLPADGHAARYRDAQGAVSAVEHARLIGVEGLLTAPDAVASAVLAAVDEADVSGIQLWRETLTAEDGTQYSDLYLIGEDGIRQVAAWGGPLGFTFEPGLLTVPADAEVGDVWSGDGSAFGDGILTYRSEYRASAPPPHVATGDGERLKLAEDCLRIDGTLIVEQPGVDPLLESTGTSIWCPRQGRVHASGDQNGHSVSTTLVAAETPLSAIIPPTSESASGAPAAAVGRVTALEAVAEDPFFGESVKRGSVTARPAVLDDGLVALANDSGDDLQVWRLGPDRATLEWTAHPGGVLVAVAEAGDVTLAATSERAVHAYDRIGRRLWSWRGAELALTPPAAAGDSDAVLATRDGRVAALELDGGDEMWSTDLGGDTRGSLVVAGDVVVVADERGRLSGIDTVSGALRWRHEAGLVGELAAPAGGDAVYAVTFDNDLMAFDPSTGDLRWKEGFLGEPQTLSASSDGVVLATDEETVGYRAVGGELWRSGGGESVPVLGSGTGVTVSAQDGAAVLRSADGEVKGEWKLPAEATVAGAHVLAGGGDLVLLDPSLLFWRLGAL